ncbi:MAG: GSU2403 family nucleotidyltransferase fold protein [Candidatus Omnitrophica bacterium]|nr:GSU2403 family nucleotidyltransferase fold protein [Candidatus Omnitrophota bacterium]
METLCAVQDSLDKIMIVGGWCPYLYAKYLWHREIPNIPTTTDIDLGVLETGSKRFARTIYDKLRAAGLAVERIYDEEPEPIEFVYKEKEIEMKVEFITSFETTDDTLNRFLGRQLACNRIDAFEILLEAPARIDIRHSGKNLRLNVPNPETFLYHKGITFVMRPDEAKRDKDLSYLYFILKFCPDQKMLLDSLVRFKKHELFESFRANLKEYLADVSKPGYKMLRPFVRRWVEEKKINQEINAILDPLLTLVR